MFNPTPADEMRDSYHAAVEGASLDAQLAEEEAEGIASCDICGESSDHQHPEETFVDPIAEWYRSNYERDPSFNFGD